MPPSKSPFSSAPPSAASSQDADLASARRVLETEARGLAELAGGLNGDFARALALLAAMTGRVIVTGMGKSGHVARKIAATLASTGTPAHYVHPGEASHGDLGMIADGDAIIALSNSGETSELADLIAYAKRYEIPLISMTSRADSTLAEAATVAFVMPAVEEACPMGLAPTTSTTMMLGLGDAIAVALLERKGFSADDFRVFHPGGKLGANLLRVADLMHKRDALPLVGRDTVMSDALLTMTAKSFGCVGIVNDAGALAGILTDGDLRRHMSGDLLTRRAADVMTAAPKTIAPGQLASEAVRIMNDSAITSLFVVEDGAPVGIIHIHDCLRAGVV